MNKIEKYRARLRTLKNWDEFLLQESGLPGPRGNIELAKAVAEEGDEDLFIRLLEYGPKNAPTNSPYEFLAFCGVLGLGRLLADGKLHYLGKLREYASDPRWRIREAVAMALQRLGEVDMNLLLSKIDHWSKGNLLEKRAVAAGLCEPKLLQKEDIVLRVLKILDEITGSIQDVSDRRSDEFKALRKGLGYCWSVAVAAFPDGREIMEKWFSSSDKDIVWIMKENLKKKRLLRMDKEWVEKWRGHL